MTVKKKATRRNPRTSPTAKNTKAIEELKLDMAAIQKVGKRNRNIGIAGIALAASAGVGIGVNAYIGHRRQNAED